MGKEGLGRRLGILILGSILACGIVCGAIIHLTIRQEGSEVKESPLVGFLAFEYDEIGVYGSLYYKTFTGEKTLITHHVLGKDREYFILDERSGLVFYKDEKGAFYMTEIGQEPKQIIASMDNTQIVGSKSGRYLFCGTYDEDDFFSYIIIDKKERMVHKVGTGLSSAQISYNPSKIAFDEEALKFCYMDMENNLYCSTAYEAPQLITKEVEAYVIQDKGVMIYKGLDQEKGSYTFANGLMEGEQLKVESLSEFLVESIEGKPVTFFRGFLEDVEVLCMQRKGEESIVLASEGIRSFKYSSETNTLYYLLDKGDLMCLDISSVEGSSVGQEKELAQQMDSFSISPNGKLVISNRNPIMGENKLYLITEEGAVLLDSHTENSQVFDTYVIYEGENNQVYIKSIVNNEVVEETILEYVVSDGYWSKGYRATSQGTYVTYFENKEGQTRLMLYTKEQGIQILIENADDYSVIKVNNQIYESPLKYGQVVGYYGNEDFDMLIEMTKDQEMIIYNEGKEKDRVAFEVTKVNPDDKYQIKLSPLSGVDFTVDIFKDRFWNDEIFLSSHGIFEKAYYDDESELILADKRLTLINLDESEFRNQLARQNEATAKKEKELLTKSEAILFTKWYISYRGEEMPAYIEVDHEAGNDYVIHAYDHTGTLNRYQVDKQSGEIIPLEEETPFTKRAHKAIMTYKVENDVLWMIDAQGNKGRLVNLDAFYKKTYKRQKETGEFLWQYGNSVYFVIRKYDTIDEYNEDTLWRYDLVQRKAIRLAETSSAFNEGVSYTLEAKRGTIKIEYCPGRRELYRVRIDPLTGETQEWIAQYDYNGNECSIAEEGELIYEVVCPKGEASYFICEYNQETKARRLLCEVDITDFYGGTLPEAAIKVKDDIYFMDYTHYLTPEEEEAKENWEFEAAYCKVNVKTGQVSRVSKEVYESVLNN